MENGINWEEVDKAQSEDELRGMKLWLFQENIRLQNERNELEDMQDKLLKERVQFREEMETLNRRIAMEQKRLREENLFLTKSWRFCRMAFASWTRTGSVLSRKSAGWNRAADIRERTRICWGREMKWLIYCSAAQEIL